VSKLSVVVITRDEERNIEACLESVHWANEIVVVDTGSTDRTLELAQRFRPRLVSFPWQGFGAAKAHAVSQASHEWIFSLDADERVTPDLAAEIENVVRTDGAGFDAYSVRRRAYFLGRWMKHGGWYPGWVVRLFRRSAGTFDSAVVHEEVHVSGKTGRLAGELLHFTDPSFDHYLGKFNRFTSLGALRLRADGQRGHWRDMVIRPPLAFMRMYLARRGFLDGSHGLLLALLSAGAVFTKYAKLWELDHCRESLPS
jgi:glycosyltransferase involved in cell wall biosynthesis